jgi:transcriptional regulator with GAF, ATPase, and Fis domain
MVETSEPLGTVDVGSTDIPETGRTKLKVVVIAGEDEGLEAALDEIVTVGADNASSIVLSDRAVSRHHLRLELSGGKVTAKDLGSRNGTFLGGARVKEIELPMGAVLTLGSSAISLQPRWFVREVAPSQNKRFGEVLGESLLMREIFAILERVARTDVTVLVEGESGTGKELIARSIHAASARADKPYVVFDCGSVPSELAESELFGHVRGAFSGAIASRAGAFPQADGGTLFLDEIGELPIDLQPKLLRVLETTEVKPVGSDTARKVSVRVVAATNRDLHAEVRRGRFRSDLLYRLDVLKLRVPPLRQRPEDLRLLIAKLLEGKLRDSEIGGENLKKLSAYAWPGNVRELRNMLARAVTLATVSDAQRPSFAELVFNLGPAFAAPATLGTEYPGVSSRVPYKDAKEQVLLSFNRAYVSALLDRHKGSVREAAKEASLSRKHFYELMRRVEGDGAAVEALPEESVEDD